MSQRAARPGGYTKRDSATPRVATAQPLDVGPFHAFVTLGVCEQPELYDLLLKLSHRGLPPTDLWASLAAAVTDWPPAKLLRRGGALVLEVPSNAEGEREVRAAQRIHAAVKRHEEASEQLLLAFAEFCAGGLDQTTRVHLNVAAAGIRAAVKALGLEIQRTTKGGRQLDPFSEDGPAAGALKRQGVGSRLRARLLCWAMLAREKGAF